MGNAIRQKSHILGHPRCPRFKIPSGILRSLFQGWIGGLVRFSLPIFSDTGDEELETSFRFALGPLTGLPAKCSNSALYAAANTQPILQLRPAAGYRGICRMLSLLTPTQSLAACGHGLIRSQGPYLQGDIIFICPQADFSSNPFAGLRDNPPE
jgi:hypothetical protein